MASLASLGIWGMFISAFLAATILPLSSEAVMSVLLVKGFSPLPLIAAATAGNVLGSVLNYLIGAWGSRFVSSGRLARYKEDAGKGLKHFRKYGTLSLLLAWMPVIGDPITLAAGIVRVNIWIFLILVTAGKGARYIILAKGILAF